jgi:hypothetical protein
MRLAWQSSRQEVPRRLRHAVELGGRQGSHAAILRLLELRGWVELRAKALQRLRSMPTTAAPAGVVPFLFASLWSFDFDQRVWLQDLWVKT